MQKRTLALAATLAVSLAPAMAHAQDAAGAEVLFQKAHQLFEAKKYAEACPKFAESYRLDPVSGSLLALAACHEADGKLASAWAEYVDVVSRARREGKNDRADAAQQRATALEPKLAHVTLALAPGADAVAGLTVKRDGIVIGAATFGTALPVDHGEHVVEASAPGRVTFTKKVTIQDGTNENVAVPALAEDPTGAVAAPGPAPDRGAEPGPEPAHRSGFPLRTLGIVAGGVGVATMIVGGVFGGLAIKKYTDSNGEGCDKTTNFCSNTTARTDRTDAVSMGNTSTALFVVGGLLTAGGIVLFIVGGSSGDSGTKTAIAAAPAVGPGGAGMSFRGRF